MAIRHDSLKTGRLRMSNETQHTPGPWFREHHPDVCYYRHQIFDEKGGHVADVACYSQHPDNDPPGSMGDNEDPPSRSNANLIAAAPELLEALQYARRIVADQLGENSAHLRPLDAAIAKASGQSNA